MKKTLKEKFRKAASGEHDYAFIYDMYNKIKSAIENSKPKHCDSIVNYTQNWIKYIRYKEEFYYLEKFPWTLVSRLCGSYKKHSDYINTVSLMIDDLDQRLDDQMNSNGKSNVGFIKRN